ncbi:MAG: galactose mutarotase [Planctomycetota bacterium]|nr:galactose mutarotase [Planctomycetota bacterium]
MHSSTRRSLGPFCTALIVLLASGPAGTPRAADEAGRGKPRVEKSVFGRLPDGTAVELYTLTNPHGLEVKVMTYGATITSVKTPDRDGKFANVTLTLDTFDDYYRGHPLFGSVVGRYAGRIAGAKFNLDGAEYPLEANAGAYHIHGGKLGFYKMLWQAVPIEADNVAGVEMSHVSPDGHAGYPGTLSVKVRYELNDRNELRMEYTAQTDKPTILNLTNHAYWNLAGAGSGDVLQHEILLNADRYLPPDSHNIPTGELRLVKDTAMDFREPQTIGSRLAHVEGQNYDHCYVLNQPVGERLPRAARVVEPHSGRVMEVSTTQPGVQFFTAKFLTNNLQAGGLPYGPYHGFCLETQHFPNAPNQPEFPSTVLRPGATFHEVTVHKFSIAP